MRTGEVALPCPPLFSQGLHSAESDGKGGWVWGVHGVRVVPYRLPELLEAISTEQPVFVLEGEKDADNLAKLNIAATCNAGGAGKWRARHAAFLKDADVIIVPDNDPPGRAHAESVARSLVGVASRIRVLKLPGLPEKGDVSNWLAAGGTAERLWQLTENAPNWSEPKPDGQAPAPGAGSEPATDEIEAEITRLAKLSLAEFESQRHSAAKKLGWRASTLDALVKSVRDAARGADGQGQALSLPEPMPWTEPVDDAELLDGLAAIIKQYVVLEEHEADAVALWILHTYVFNAFTVTPRLGITSPEKRCGKTTLQDVLGCLVPRPLPAANITAAATFRTIELAQPTLLIDEADTFLGDNEDLRGVLNSGHRKGGSIVRLVGEKHEPRRFATFTPVAIAMIGSLPGTLADRSIHIRLRRRRADEAVAPFRDDRAEGLARLASMAARWAADNREDSEVR